MERESKSKRKKIEKGNGKEWIKKEIEIEMMRKNKAREEADTQELLLWRETEEEYKSRSGLGMETNRNQREEKINQNLSSLEGKAGGHDGKEGAKWRREGRTEEDNISN